jgi:hypothetical protein
MSEQFSGRVTIVDSQGREVFAFDSQFAVLDIGALGNEGDLRLRGNDGETKIHLDGGRQLLNITNEAGVTVFRFDASHSILDLGPSLGGEGAEADLRIFGADGKAKIHLDGNTGDITLANADAAEEFDVWAGAAAEPGTVMVLEDGGLLRPSERRFDRRVVGVVAGAGGYRPGLILDRQDSSPVPRAQISVMGKVRVNAVAEGQPIRVGDLLTTSSALGRAMAVGEEGAPMGAIFGKALTPIANGIGMVDMLVTLQ